MAIGAKFESAWNTGAHAAAGVFWSAMAMCCEGIFWTCVGLLSEIFKFLHELLERFIALGPGHAGQMNVPVYRHQEEGPTYLYDSNVAPMYEPNVVGQSSAYGRENVPHHRCGNPQHCNKKWYAVVRGRNPGIYECWEETKEQVHEYSENRHKSFKLREQAEDWYLAHMG